MKTEQMEAHTVHKLPEPFQGLEPLVGRWALPDQNARFYARVERSMEEIRAFYDAIAPHMEAIMAYLAERPPADLAPADDRLLRLALSYMEVSRVVEVWGQQDVRADFFDPRRLRFEAAQGLAD
jgi:hypothetical protein